MPNPKRGGIRQKNGKYYARVSYKAADGKRYYIERLAENKSHARQLVRTLLTEIEIQAGAAGSKMTLAELANFYRVRYIAPPQYQNNQKVDGLRGHKEQNRLLDLWINLAGSKKIRDFTAGDLDQLRKQRLATPTKDQRPRTVATVNRELAILRRLFNVAVQEGWIVRNPFQAARALIRISEEVQRDRLLSFEEEKRLLEVCDGPRIHLYVIIVCALDTGMRRGEILKLNWADIDFKAGKITVQALNSKTLKKREIQMTQRLENTLEQYKAFTKGSSDDLVFGIGDFKKSWARACKLAEIEGLHFHDLRHTAATRLIQGGLSLAEVGRILGHASPVTTYRYVNADEQTGARAAAILDAHSKRR